MAGAGVACREDILPHQVAKINPFPPICTPRCSFVVQTILTVDDFLLFKSMMVKRNIDLTNQVGAQKELRGKEETALPYPVCSPVRCTSPV